MQKSMEENVVYLGDDKPVIINTSTKEKHSKAKQKEYLKEEAEKSEKNEHDKKGQQPIFKRGQKGKLKKMKEKYKDQDEEDRRLSMLVLQVLFFFSQLYVTFIYIIYLFIYNLTYIYLYFSIFSCTQSAGAAKEDKRKNRIKDPSGPKQQGKKKTNPKPNVPLQSLHMIDNIDDEDTGPIPEVDMLDQLTGKPFSEDELLFAVPVIAPYNTLQNYK